MERDAGRQLDHAIIEPHAAGIVQPDQADDILDLEGMGEVAVPHMPPDGKMQIGLLQMELRRGEPIEITT